MKKITIIISLVSLIIIGICFVIGNKFNSEIVKSDSIEDLSQTSASDDEWEVVNSGNVSMENDFVHFQMDSDTTHFIVTYKQSGKEYHSVSQVTTDFEPSAEQSSEIIIKYYDENSAKTTMNSCENSVEGKSYTIKTNGSAIRVYYRLQKSKKRIFVPAVISQTVFEIDILEKIESGPKRRLKGFYTLYESKNNDSSTKRMKSLYPALKEENLYILNDTAGEHNYSEITGYFNMAEYSQNKYAEELERLELGNSINDNLPAEFLIPVEYNLKDDGFEATVLTDRITSGSAKYQLTNVSILPYFASCGSSQNGWFLVPDGSGAIINLSEKADNNYQQCIYGNDPAIESSVKSNIIQNAGLPVFGFNSGDSAMFAYISGGAATATVNAEVYGREYPQSHIYSDFMIRAYDSSSIGASRNQADFNLYSANYVTEFPRVTYKLFPDSDTTYSDMAGKCREMLLKNGVLGEKLGDTKVLPIYIDFTGYEMTAGSFLGISINNKTKLSTIEDINKSLSELMSRGISGINLRLKAYANGGIYSKVSNGFCIDSCVGNQKSLDLLAKLIASDNGTLFLENNISTVYKSGNSYKKMKHASRNLKKMIAYGIDFDLVSRKNTEAVNKYYMTSPAYFDSLTNNFIQTLSEKSDDISVYGYSWSDFGSKLWSDFHETSMYDRTQSEKAAVKAMKRASSVFSKTITDGSNSYTLSTASNILNMPLRYSAMSSESYSIPFYQMVIHGYIDYAGAPINASADSEQTYLASVESGANLYYSFYTSEKEPLKKTDAGTLTYPTLISASYDDIEIRYKEFQKVFTKLRSQTIIRHERIADDVFATTYEDGTEIFVNYSKKDFDINDIIVEPNGFAVIERR